MFHELPKGGAENAVFEISRRLKKEGIIVDLYTTIPINKAKKNYFYKVYHYNFYKRIWLGRNWRRRLYKDTLEMLHLYFLHKKIAKDIDRRKYDIAFINASLYIESPFILRFIKTKTIFYCHDPHDRLVYDKLNEIPFNIGMLRIIYEKIIRLIRKWLDRNNFQKADYLFANSFYSQKTIKKTYGRESKVVYLGVDAKKYSSKKREKKFDVLYIGSTSEFDGFRLFLRVCSLLPKKVVVRSILADQEWLTSERLNEEYNLSRVVLALGVREPFGLIPIEAMSCSVPVIAVDEGGYKETVVDGATGFLVKKDSKIIVNKIMYLLNNQNIASEFGKNARKTVEEKWSWEVSSKKMISALIQVANKI